MHQIQESQILLVASSLAYTTVLSLIPLLAVSFSIFHAFGGLEKLFSTIEPFIIENLAEASGSDAMEAIRRFISNAHAGVIGVSGLIALIITSMSMLSSAEKAINRIWKAPISRSLFQRVATYWLFITLGPISLSVGIGFITSSQLGGARILPSGTGVFLLVWFLLFSVYKWVPNRNVHVWPAAASALIIACTWNLARLSYRLYTSHVITYSKIYGSLGAIPILLLWIYILWAIVLMGAAISAALQKRFDPK